MSKQKQTRFEKMMEAYNKVDDVKAVVNPTVSELKDNYQKELSAVKQDRMLSDEGRRIKEEEIQKKYGDEFLKNAKYMRETHDNAVLEAQATATNLLNEEPPEPFESEKQTFERRFNDLKTELMLEVDKEKAAKKLGEFADKQKDPYFHYQLKNDFANLIQTLGNDDVEVVKQLRRTYESVLDKSKTEEQQEAQRVMSSLEGAYGSQLFKDLQTDVINRTIGEDYARHANNPDGFEQEA